MNGFMKPYQVERIKNTYPKGSRIMVDNMDDPYSPIPPGTTATVDFVDDAGQLHCTYDGVSSSLALIPNEDEFHIIKEKENTIKVLVIEPMKAPYISEIKNEYEAMQEVVGGYIEYVGLDEECHLYCNEEGKIDGLKGNRKMDFGDVICGTFFICQTDEYGDDKSISEDNVKKYTDRFKELENYEGMDFSNPTVLVTTYPNAEELLKAMGKTDSQEDFER